MTQDPIITEKAIQLYDTYTAAVGGKAWNGDPLPSGEEFFNDPARKLQADAWRAVARNAIIGASCATNLPFSAALELLKHGLSVRLPHWKPDVRIKIQLPDEHSKMTHPYLYVESRFGCVPWVITQVELMSNSWEIARDPQA